MKTLTLILACLLATSVMAQDRGRFEVNGMSLKYPSNYYPIMLNGIAERQVIDTVYSAENNKAFREIKSLFTMRDSTKYQENYKTFWNDNLRSWSFHSVTVQIPQFNYFIIGSRNNFYPLKP